MNFYDATFHRLVSFYEVGFKEGWEVVFDNAKFLKGVSFVEVEFEKSANFSRAKFDGVADFDGVVFHGEVNFSEAQFNKGASFRGSCFNRRVDFSKATFAQRILFSPEGNFSPPARKDGCFLADCSFNELLLKKDVEVIFENVNLSKASFTGTNIESFTFHDVQWASLKSKLGRWFRGNYGLWDELQPISKYADYDYEKIAENYSQLVLNYENKRDYDAAEHFHIGEMEIRRKKKKFSWLNGYAIYAVSSRYGTSYIQAFVVLFSIMAVFSTIFLVSGFKLSETSNDTVRIINYDACRTCYLSFSTLYQFILDYIDALAYSASLITLQRMRYYEPVGMLTRIGSYFAMFILIAQAALVLLAIRRRFKR